MNPLFIQLSLCRPVTFIWGSWKLIIRKCLLGVIQCENVSLHKAASGNLRLDSSNDNYFNSTASNLNCKIIFSQNKHRTNKQTRQLVGQRGRTCQEMESAADDDDDDGNVISFADLVLN